ncbi:glutathione peroxidase [Roseivivax isoporae]|uniref:Glutathione peroxidase n=1 Tax=Roseivivax isoporae LMG 25204 TaxID=1449351 RepID=X7FAY0_9RHOB|nr:glutathione peroxidase [Roseivivax isoporae]ETX29271.1 glutathione peroxidase [Roseivivax isoporae LMG 25204]
MFRLLATLVFVLAALPALALERFTFPSIDGGKIASTDWQGRPVLVVNTASRCAFTPQYDALQALYDRYRDAGLIVLAVPSNDFRQELESAEAVKDFCELNFGLDLPMTTITAVTGPRAHPFYRWLAETEGFRPAWNFNKVLIAPDGSVAGTWGSAVRPMSEDIVGRIEALLRPARG